MTRQVMQSRAFDKLNQAKSVVTNLPDKDARLVRAFELFHAYQSFGAGDYITASVLADNVCGRCITE